MAATLTISNPNMEMFTDPYSVSSVDQPLGRRGRLIDTMQIVEPRVSAPVPNHILDTKLFCKVADNGLVRVNPMVVHFGGFEPGRGFSRTLELQNMSTDIQQMHIIPPQTKYFRIKYTKSRKLVPGFVLSCLIEFFPDEWRYYYDCVRIHCKGEKNLIVPIHAYPVMNTSEFPQMIDFPAVPLGDTKTKVFPLRCHAPIDFEFRLTYLQPHPAYKVEPMSGIVPSNGEVDIFVSFSPTSFSSAMMRLQLDISQFLAGPLVCMVTGRCLPGMKREILRASDRALESALAPQMTLDPLAISPLDRARSRKMKTKTPRLPSEAETQVMERDGVRIQDDLSNPHSVGIVLNQKPGMLRVRDLHSTVFGSQSQAKPLTRQMKEAMFDVAIRKDVYQERQNQLRWQVKRGQDAVTTEFCSRVLRDREVAQRAYQLKRGDLDEEDECCRTAAQLTSRRTRRLASVVAAPVATFDAYVNDLSLKRHATISRFQQAARKVILQRRVEPRLQALRKLLTNPEPLNPDNDTIGAVGTVVRCDAGDSTVDASQMMSVARVTSVTFPVYVAAREEDELVTNGPGILPLKPQEIRLKEKVPYFALKVPQQYKLLGYRSFDVQVASSSYVPEGLVKPLRTGAEDEVIDLPQPLNEDTIAKFAVASIGVNQSFSTRQGSEVTVLAPPKAMFQPIKYPALHIFNPVPGLMAFQNHLPYSELDPDFHMCPLPRYLSSDATNPHMATQKQYLDREEIIKGVMSWKKFPSPSIASLSGCPSLANVWVPRWKDPFSEDLLPFGVPPLLDSLPKDDKMGIISEQIGGSGDHEAVCLTPEMVRAQFAAVDGVCSSEEDTKEVKEDVTTSSLVVVAGLGAGSRHENPVVLIPESGKLPASNLPFGINGPIPRDQRESELDRFLRSRHGVLGRRIQWRICQMNSSRKDTKTSLMPR